MKPAQEILNTVSLKDIPKILGQLTEAEQRQLLGELDKLGELKNKELAQEKFIAFVNKVWPSFIAGRHHARMAAAFEEVANGTCKRLIINMPPRHDLAINEEVPTTLGWKRIKDISVGDYVFAPTGYPVLVTGKSAVNQKPTYVVTTSDGAALKVSEDHLWTVRFECEVGAKYKTYSTQALYERQQKHPNTSKPPKLPPLSPLQYPEAVLPIDPYVLGVWLGDGSSGSSSIGCSHTDMPAMRSQVESCGYATTHNPKFQQFNVLGLHQQLRELGMLGNKHIPEQYLCSSIEQRMALLQGLIDTDGDVTKEGKITFNQTNLSLTQQVLCLIHSLGVKARITNRQTSYKGTPSQPSHRIMFKLANAARIPRKAVRCKALEGNWSRVIHVQPTGLIEATQCLQVDNEDGLFVAGRGHLVTHNTKSEFASYLLPAWFLGKFPGKKVIQTSHTAELAVGFGRKVRNLVASDPYKAIFPGVGLQADSKAAGRWATNAGGDYFAIGVGGAVTGKGADLLIIDDPHSEQEATLAETNSDVYDKTYEWYTSGPRQRLQPGGAIVIVMCMTGDTPVLMADKTEKLLRDIRVGDEVATFEKGNLTSAKVNNFKSNGFDTIYKVQTQSGKIIRANARHPFLVDNHGVLEWTRLEYLKLGDELVSLKDAIGLQEQKQNQANVDPAQSKLRSQLHLISDFTTDPIVQILHDGQEEVFDVEVDRTENFIANGFVSHNTRWSKKDLTGQVIKADAQRGGEGWKVIEFPAILPSGNPLWPEFWPMEQLEALRDELPVSKWQAQYQQQPTSSVSAIIKREWWREWESDNPPHCDFVIQSWDTAFLKTERSDYSACTTWGVFYKDDDTGRPQANIILLNAIKKRMEFPELKQRAYEEWQEWQPDALIVEAKASGSPLLFELRAMGIPVQEYTPGKGSDKIARLNSVADIFASGMVWVPATRWAEELVEEVASFPSGEHDDLVDSMTQAIMRFRRGGFLRLDSDEPDPIRYFKSKKNAGFYRV